MVSFAICMGAPVPSPAPAPVPGASPQYVYGYASPYAYYSTYYASPYYTWPTLGEYKHNHTHKSCNLFYISILHF